MPLGINNVSAQNTIILKKKNRLWNPSLEEELGPVTGEAASHSNMGQLSDTSGKENYDINIQEFNKTA